MSNSNPVVREGVAAGLIGATAVAVWFGVLDAIRGHLLATPMMLGNAVGSLFLKNDTPSSAAAFLGYTLVHYAVFVVAGLVFAWVVQGSERVPSVLIGFIGLFVAFEVGWIGFTSILARGFGELTWLQVFIANLIGAGCMGLYMWRQHPTLLGRVERELAGQE